MSNPSIRSISRPPFHITWIHNFLTISQFYIDCTAKGMATKDFDADEWTRPFQVTPTIHRHVYEAVSWKNPELSAAGKIIVITGGGTGIGAAAARVWAMAGAEGVVLAGRRLEKLEQSAAETRRVAASSGIKVIAVATDVSKEKDVEALFARISQEFGRPADVVVANAGALNEMLPVGRLTADGFWDIVAVNLKGAYAMAHHFIKSQPNPEAPKGTFINVNSGLAGAVEKLHSAYSIAKLGAQRLTEYLDAGKSTMFLRQYLITDIQQSTPH
jgi:NADP-dependent 3-hydroxy acid dehydrogenase YdfG